MSETMSESEIQPMGRVGWAIYRLAIYALVVNCAVGLVLIATHVAFVDQRRVEPGQHELLQAKLAVPVPDAVWDDPPEMVRRYEILREDARRVIPEWDAHRGRRRLGSWLFYIAIGVLVANGILANAGGRIYVRQERRARGHSDQEQGDEETPAGESESPPQPIPGLVGRADGAVNGVLCVIGHVNALLGLLLMMAVPGIIDLAYGANTFSSSSSIEHGVLRDLVERPIPRIVKTNRDEMDRRFGSFRTHAEWAVRKWERSNRRARLQGWLFYLTAGILVANLGMIPVLKRTCRRAAREMPAAEEDAPDS